jgi:23S rRNA pseudouridine2605 synthase
MTRRAKAKTLNRSAAADWDRQKPHGEKPDHERPLQRLQKVMAAAGIGSRRHCEELILSGRVEVDGQVVNQLGSKVNPARQRIRVDGVALRPMRLVYYLVNKPPGVVSTSYDPSGRLRVVDLVPSGQRVYTVGRLDRASQGLMLVTNDGELANRLTHPRYGVEKTYQVTVAGQPSRENLKQLTRGIHLAEGVATAARVTILHTQPQSTQLEIALREGKNREIRRVLAKIGHKVLRLKRVAIGGVALKNLPLGAYRRLLGHELEELRAAARVPGAGVHQKALRRRATKSAGRARQTALPAEGRR